jgi:hypothetical protein
MCWGAWSWLLLLSGFSAADNVAAQSANYQKNHVKLVLGSAPGTGSATLSVRACGDVGLGSGLPR